MVNRKQKILRTLRLPDFILQHSLIDVSLFVIQMLFLAYLVDECR